ncbi:MAG: hypothetical protein ACKO23_17075 [Gemmataceae bacterium]
MKGCIHWAAGLAVLLVALDGRAQTGCSTGDCGVGSGVGVGGKHGCGSKKKTDKCDLYDHCWPSRYSNLAHRAVNRAFTPQVQNGHVLEQTIWNYMFEPGTDVLTPMGLAQLQHLSRRRPEADRTVYLATSLDLQYDPACPERYAGARQELDTLRVAAVQKYLVAVNAGRGQDFQVLLHDPADVSVYAQGPANAIMQMYGSYRGSMRGGQGGGGGGGLGNVTLSGGTISGGGSTGGSMTGR